MCTIQYPKKHMNPSHIVIHTVTHITKPNYTSNIKNFKAVNAFKGIQLPTLTQQNDTLKHGQMRPSWPRNKKKCTYKL